MRVISTDARPHIVSEAIDCWCRPTKCPCCGEDSMHRSVEARPDNQLRMASFSDQLITIQTPI